MTAGAPAGPARWCVLIPAHNEAKTIRAIAEAARAHVPHVLVIDDGSTDGTAAALEGLDVRAIRHDTNRGKGPRLAEGLAAAAARGAEGILTLDADGQHDPADIPAFMAAAEAAPGALVVGDRFADREGMPPSRRRSIRFGDFFISWAAGRRIHDCQCGMRLYPAAILPCLPAAARDRQHFVFETAILIHAAAAGVPIVRVPIRARYAGFTTRQSHFRPVLDTLRIVRSVTLCLLRAGLRPRGLLIALGLLR